MRTPQGLYRCYRLSFPREELPCWHLKSPFSKSLKHAIWSTRSAELRDCLRWADVKTVTLEDGLRREIHGGFPQGDDAFDAVVGLFGMLQACLGQRGSGEPDDRAIREIESWILGREP